MKFLNIMCRFTNRPTLLILWALSLVVTSHAQNTSSTKETSPYSKYGLGDEVSGANVSLRGMGYLTVTGADFFTINTENPASYAWLKLTTFELGGEASRRGLKTKVGNYQSGTATLSYLNLGIPVGKYLGFNAGLKPIARTYYNYTDTQNVANVGKVEMSSTGEGGTNEIVLGMAGRIKGFSLGANAAYKFGEYEYTNNFIPLADTNAKASEYLRRYKINGWHFTVGAIYVAPLNKKLTLRSGITAELSHNLRATRNEYWYSYSKNGFVGTVDTAYRKMDEKGAVALPLKLGIGTQLFGTDKWSAGINVHYANWSNYRIMGNKDSIGNSALRLSLGGSYTPNATDYFKYFPRVTYKLGFYYGRDKLQIQGTQLNYWGVTGGLSLPFRRFNDRIHVSLDYGQRGTTANGLIKENHFRFGLGFSLNDRWFIKPKYD